MASGELGRVYEDGEEIICEGAEGNCMFVIQEGEVEVLIAGDEEKEIRLGVRGEGEFFGEMAIFDRDVRSATVRALGEARVLTVDKKNFMRRVHEDPSLAFRLVETMSHRIRELGEEVARLQKNQLTQFRERQNHNPITDWVVFVFLWIFGFCCVFYQLQVIVFESLEICELLLEGISRADHAWTGMGPQHQRNMTIGEPGALKCLIDQIFQHCSTLKVVRMQYLDPQR